MKGNFVSPEKDCHFSIRDIVDESSKNRQVALQSFSTSTPKHRSEFEGGKHRHISLEELIEKMSGRSIPADSIMQVQEITKAPSKKEKIPPRERGMSLYLYDTCETHHIISKSFSETPNTSTFDITVVTVGSFNRLFILPIFASRWDGPIVFVIHLLEEQQSNLDEFLRDSSHSILCNPRIRILTYVAEKGAFFYDNYPINILRNIGIRNVRTSHFIVLDMDMWMSQGSYQTLLTLPEEIKQSTRTAVIIPAFFHTGWTITNGTLQEQVASVLNRIPFSMSDLLECVKISKCSPMKKGLFTHLYVPQKWIDDKRRGNYLDYYDYACWKNDLQEPYLLVARNDSIALFNEAFINYGFNKISYVETLRREEYRFILAGKVFAFDLPHLPSRFQKSHVTNTQSGNYMTNYYYMQRLVKRTKNNTHILKVCKH